MIILELRAENIKRLTVVNIRPDRKLVLITGKNSNGKTSVLDAIWWALSGAHNIPERPIRDGASEALIHLDMGDLKVTRTFHRHDDQEPPYTTKLTVEAADGSRLKTPQTVLDAMIGSLSFDPLQFTRMLPREQFNALRAFVPGIDFDKIDAENKRDYEKRTDENRRAADLKAQAAGIVVPEKVDQVVDVTKLVANLDAAGVHNTEIEKRRAARSKATQDITHMLAVADKAQDQINRLKQTIQTLGAEATESRERARALQERLSKAAPLPDPIDTDGLTKAIADAQTANEGARKAKERGELLAKVEHHEGAANALTEAMRARKEHVQAVVAAAQMPVEGIGFGEGEVLLNNRPFAQASDAEQLRASVAIAVAMNPKIRVVRVRDGSLLDEDGLKLLAEMAERHDCQLWLERVTNDGAVGFVMEDGHLKEAT